MEWLLILAALFLAYSNGANDNFKGVATLLGSRTFSFRNALAWATATTFAGSLTAIMLSGALVRSFSGRGLVPGDVVTPVFLTAVGLGAAATVWMATRAGFPISTTHGLVGALVGTGFAIGPDQVRLAALGQAFFVPLLISPVLALCVAACAYPMFRWTRRRMRVERETCVCLDDADHRVPFGAMAIKTPGLALHIDSLAACQTRYPRWMPGVGAQKILDGAHILSAGAVCFARGLNDTPKIVALLVGAQMLDVAWASLAVGVAMAGGGLLSVRQVAETMSYRITDMNRGQGFTANLVTSGLVLCASHIGLPVSTTHVSCGALFGIGRVTQQGHWPMVRRIALSWVVTLPVAALLSCLIFLIVT